MTHAGEIIKYCLESESVNPYELFQEIVSKDFVPIHGPIHHFIDGAALLTTFYNAGGKEILPYDLEQSLEELLERSMKMPGAMCGEWGACGAATSVGAALSIIDGTGPLSDIEWGSHMGLTAKVLYDMSKMGGPRCCKRNAYFALKNATNYINENYNVVIHWTEGICKFTNENLQCLKEKCPLNASNIVA